MVFYNSTDIEVNEESTQHKWHKIANKQWQYSTNCLAVQSRH